MMCQNIFSLLFYYPVLYLSPHHTDFCVTNTKQLYIINSNYKDYSFFQTHYTLHCGYSFYHNVKPSIPSIAVAATANAPLRKTLEEMGTGSEEDHVLHQTPLRIPELLYVSVKMENPKNALAGNLFPHICGSSYDSSQAVIFIHLAISFLFFWVVF